MNKHLKEKTQSLLKRFDHGVMHPSHVLLAAISLYNAISEEVKVKEEALQETCRNLRGLPKYSSDTLQISDEAEELLKNVNNIDDLLRELGIEKQKTEAVGEKPTSPEPSANATITINTDFEGIMSQLKATVQGQDHAVDAVVNRLAVFVRELDVRPERPNGVFLFAGPTG
ncbi:MAG: hypothetical protein ACO3BI_06170, partial [Candidatus Nanopelagicales bacterium]